MDIFPTLTLLAGAQVPLAPAYYQDGYLLWGLLEGSDDPWHVDTFLNHFPHQHRGSYFTSWRHGDWKLIYYYNPDHPNRPQCVLFNLKKDPSESQDVLRKNRSVARRLLREMIDRLERDNATYPVDFEGKPVLPREDAIR
jgi:arylsulfatase A-like enzyme